MPFYIPNGPEFPFFHILHQHLFSGFLFVYNDSYPNECEGLPHCDLDVHFPDVRGSRQGNDQKCAVCFSANEVCREDLEVTRIS